LAHCYGCGRLNLLGHQIKTFWDGEETVTHFTPKPEHMAVPGFTYGGLMASLIDCHGTGTAAAAMYKSEAREMDTLPVFRFVTGSLHVDYLKPTPITGTLEIRGRVKEIKGRKVIVEATVWVDAVKWWRCKCRTTLVAETLRLGLFNNCFSAVPKFGSTPRQRAHPASFAIGPHHLCKESPG
jgi:acyl-coenzyme A thioesterase PaaI-like protein